MEKLNLVTEVFKQRFGLKFQTFAAPGRINIIGEHTDYNNGYVLPAAIDKYIYLAIEPTSAETINIVSADYNQMVSFDSGSDLCSSPSWALYPYGVVQEIRRLGRKVGGFNAVFGGDIPLGAGLSSSAALESVFAYALNTIFDLGFDRIDLVKIGQSAEHNYVGVKCGIMDQFTSIFGKKGYAILLDCRSLGYKYIPLNLTGYKIVLVDSRVKHSLVSSEYNTRRQQCENGVNLLKKQKPSIQSLRDVTSHHLKDAKGLLDEVTQLRCSYVVEENDRVVDACKALNSCNMKKLGELLFLSHQGLSNKYQVSCPELDFLIDTAKTVKGLVGARMMGGGFGGCSINIMELSAVENFERIIRDEFTRKFHNEPVFYSVNIDDGASEIITHEG